MGCEEIVWFPSITIHLARVIYAEMYIAQNFLCCDVFVLIIPVYKPAPYLLKVSRKRFPFLF